MVSCVYVFVFVFVFASVHQAYMNSPLIPYRYNVPAEKRPAEMPPATWEQQILQPIRLRVLNFLRLWVDLRFADFDYSMMKQLNQFIEQLVAGGQHQRFADNLTNLVRKKVRT